MATVMKRSLIHIWDWHIVMFGTPYSLYSNQKEIEITSNGWLRHLSIETKKSEKKTKIVQEAAREAETPEQMETRRSWARQRQGTCSEFEEEQVDWTL